MDEFRQFGSIISVTTDVILARCMSSLKIIGSAEKNRVGREPEPQVFFLSFINAATGIPTAQMSDNN
jgi:hypothetical protein